MAVTYRIDADERIVHITISGDSHFAEWRDVMLAALSGPSFVSGMGFLSDRRSQTNIDSTDIVEGVINFFKKYAPQLDGCHWAAVSGDNDAAFGMLRMLSIRSDGTVVTVRAFRDFEEARLWLTA